ncbi:MAG: oxygen-independent coproporphyrinogen III oxidase [Clostridia bacterium]|nr:oxygen-independent coproporphyrinogen III oxidase [Clostridia bacterium]
MKKLGLYIHIPFCKRKCYYCDFVSFSGKEKLIEQYINSLKQEIKKCKINKEEYQVKTIYFGGGTPSFINSSYITDIIKELKQKFNISENAEITIEINPGTVDEQKLKDYYNAGINRISFGLQTTKSELLKLVGRIHSYSSFLEAYNLARKVGFKNINVDLMIGLPVQTIQDIEEDLERIINLNPEHISVYSLIVEEGTKIEEKIDKKELYLPSEELERKMYWKVKEELEKNGYVHYEISNFAKKGFESKHNLACWNQEEYIGFGLAAHSYINNTRYSNTENLEEYVTVGADAPVRPQTTHEIQTKEDKMKEYMLLGLRKIEGIKISDFKNKFVENPIYLYRESLNKLVIQELIEIDIDNIKLTNKGIDLANLVWEEFV